jgi:hypothetical protein
MPIYFYPSAKLIKNILFVFKCSITSSQTTSSNISCLNGKQVKDAKIYSFVGYLFFEGKRFNLEMSTPTKKPLENCDRLLPFGPH